MFYFFITDFFKLVELSFSMRKLQVALFFTMIFFMAPSNFLNAIPPKDACQYIDDRNGLVLPWFTRSFLDVLVTWDTKNWDVFEWGSGYSTIWLAANCHSVTSIETYKEWVDDVSKELNNRNLHNAIVKYREGELSTDPIKNPSPFLSWTGSTAYPWEYSLGERGENSPYVNAIDEDDKLYDCIIIDGYHRNTCAKHILKHLKPGGIVILDNANQASLGINSTKTFEILKAYKRFSFLDKTSIPFLPDWRTDYWIIDK